MATWVSHLMVADKVLNNIPSLCKHEFCVGNIAPDCNVENEDWTAFTPSRNVTHWMMGERKAASDCDAFMQEYIKKRTDLNGREESFLLGYYSHLLTDVEFQRYMRDKHRIKESFKRIKRHSELAGISAGMEETWETVKSLFGAGERMKDIYSLEREYLDGHPDSGYFTEILSLEVFPDYIDYLPKGAIVRKIKVMGYIPKIETSRYPYVWISKDEYHDFIINAAAIVAEAINKYIMNKAEKNAVQIQISNPITPKAQC